MQKKVPFTLASYFSKGCLAKFWQSVRPVLIQTFAMAPIILGLACAAALAVITLVYLKLSRYVAFCVKRQQTGCSRARRYPHSEPFFGYDLYKQRQRALRDGNLQALYTRHFNLLGKTWEETFLDQRVINTMDIANHHYIHTFGFEEFGKPTAIFKISAPILGNGIFKAEGAQWKQSRSIIKPIFAKADTENIEMMARHVDRFLALIPRDYSTYDIQPMLKKLVRLAFHARSVTFD